MRPRSIVALLIMSVIVACTSPKTETTPRTPGVVKMTLTCSPDGTLGGFALDPWSVTLPNKHAAFVFINQPASNADGVINTKDPQFPFGGQPFRAGKGATVQKYPVTGTPAGTYKYSVTVICPISGGGSDTTVVDPDMIIPWKIDLT
jgi:hypothetical protein